MFYPNNINARSMLNGNAINDYTAYADQRRMMLEKNENDFSTSKRSKGNIDYDDNNFNFMYPIFKTPELDKADVQALIIAGLADADDPNSTATYDDAYDIVYSTFAVRFTIIVDKYDYMFKNLEHLITEKYARAQNPAKPAIQAEILKEADKLTERFSYASEREVILNGKLNESRRTYYRNLLSPKKGEKTPPFPAAQPFYKVKKLYENSDIWSTFRNMPKGGLLHMHTSSSVTPEWIIDTLVNDADNNYAKYGVSYVVLDKDPKKYGKLTFDMPNGGPYAKVTRELLYEKYDGKLGRDLIQLMSFGSDRIDSIDYIWDEFNNVFSKTGDLLDNHVFYKDYYTEAFKKLVDDNVEYLELRSGFGKFNGHNDDYFLNLLINAEADAMTYAAQKGKKFKLRIILSGNRGKSRKFDTVQKMLKAARWALDNRYSDYIIGFDLVSEEDRGCNTEMYAQFIISSQIYKILNFYFHDGETSWQFNTNMIDAYMLSDRRVGHGFGLHSFPNLTDNLSYEQNTPTHQNLVMNAAAINAANNGNLGAYFTFWENTLNDIKADNTLETDEKKFTYLLELIRPQKDDGGDGDKKKPNMPDIELPDFPETGTTKIPGKDIGRACALALEICPISNQMLRYTPDLRLHPAITLLHRGVQCVLANDDPQIFGNTGLTYDFISAFYAWDLDLWQIKQLIVNSLVYSAIPRDNNITEADPYDDILMALNRFNVLWHLFLFEEVPDLPSDEMLNEIALPGQGVHGGGHVGLVKDPAYNLNYSATSIDNLYLNYLDI